MEGAGLDLGAGLGGLATLLSNVVPLFVLCSPRDVASVPMVRAPHDELPTIYLYDQYPGGIGLARKVYETDHQILSAARVILTECGCGGGCPSCVGPGLELSARSKLSARVLLEAILSGN
jgi:DEAD/DEAH box helicase domain-containing protein